MQSDKQVNQPRRAKQVAHLINADLRTLGLRRLASVTLTVEEQSVHEAQSVHLVGTAGSEIWPVFAASPEYTDGVADPLDRWSHRVLGALGATHNLRVAFPSDGPPYLPVVSWALRSGQYHSAPLGMAIHAQFGLWTSFRGLLFDGAPVSQTLPTASPCEGCVGQPCRTACPVDAFTQGAYDVSRCATAIFQRSVPCATDGCLARVACPVGASHKYCAEQISFHMLRFVSARAG